MSHELHNLVTKIENACDSESYEVADTEHLVRLAVAEYVVAQNGLVASARVVDPTAVQKVIDRHIRENISAADPQTWFANVATKVADFLELAYEDRTNNESAEHVDLLPIGHPRNIKNLGLTASARMQAVAEWVAADPRITSDLGRQAVYNAYRAKPESLEATYANAKIEALAASGVLPVDFAYEAIVASFKKMSFAERSARSRALAKVRRYDRRRRYANEFGRLRGFFSKGDGSMFSATGKIAGAVPGENKYYVEFDGSDPEIPKGLYIQDASKSENVRALLSDRTLKNAPNLRKPIGDFDKFDQESAVSLEDFLATKVESPGDWTKNKDGSFSSNTGNKVKEVDSLPEGDYYFEGVGENNEQDLGEPLFEIRDSKDELLGVAQDWNGIQKIALTKDSLDEKEANKAPEINDETFADALAGMDDDTNWDDLDDEPIYESPNGVLRVSFGIDGDSDGYGGVMDISGWHATLDPDGEAIDLGSWRGSADDDLGDIAERVTKGYEEYKAKKAGEAAPAEPKAEAPAKPEVKQTEKSKPSYLDQKPKQYQSTLEKSSLGYSTGVDDPGFIEIEKAKDGGYTVNHGFNYMGDENSTEVQFDEDSKTFPTEKEALDFANEKLAYYNSWRVDEDAANYFNDRIADAAPERGLGQDVPEAEAPAKPVKPLSEKQMEPASPKQYALLKEFQEERDGIDENQNQAINDALEKQNLSKAQMASLFGDLQKKPFKPEIDPTKPSDRMINSLRDYLTNKELTPDEINSALDELEAGLDRAGVEKLLAKLRRRPDKAKEEGLGQSVPSDVAPFATPQGLANGFWFDKSKDGKTWSAENDEGLVEVTENNGKWFTTERSGGNGESGFTRESEKQHANAQEAFEYAAEVAGHSWDQDLYDDLNNDFGDDEDEIGFAEEEGLGQEASPAHPYFGENGTVFAPNMFPVDQLLSRPTRGSEQEAYNRDEDELQSLMDELFSAGKNQDFEKISDIASSIEAFSSEYEGPGFELKAEENIVAVVDTLAFNLGAAGNTDKLLELKNNQNLVLPERAIENIDEYIDAAGFSPLGKEQGLGQAVPTSKAPEGASSDDPDQAALKDLKQYMLEDGAALVKELTRSSDPNDSQILKNIDDSSNPTGVYGEGIDPEWSAAYEAAWKKYASGFDLQEIFQGRNDEETAQDAVNTEISRLEGLEKEQGLGQEAPTEEAPSVDLSNYEKKDTIFDRLIPGDLIPEYYPIRGTEDWLLRNRAEDPNFELPPTDEIIARYKTNNPKKMAFKVRSLKTGKERIFEVTRAARIYDIQRLPVKPKEPEQAPAPSVPQFAKEGDYRRPVRQRGGQWEDTGYVFENGVWRKATPKEDAVNGVTQTNTKDQVGKDGLVPLKPGMVLEPTSGQTTPSAKRAEDATDAQYNYISSMLNGKEVPEELATAAKQAIEDRNLSKAQVGEIIGKMRDLPNKEGFDPNAPTERMIESVKRNIVAKGLSQEDQDAILQDLPNMDKATMSELIGRLKAMDDVNAPEEGLGQQSVNDLDAEVEDIALELDSEGVGGPFVSGKGLRRSIEDFISDKYRKYASIRMQSVNDIRDLAADIKDGNLSQRLNNLADKLKAELVETFGIAEVAKTNDENDEIYLDDVRDSIEADKGMYFETDANVLADKLESDLAYGDSKSGGAEVFVYQEEDGTWTATVDYDRDSEEFKSEDRDEVIQQAAAAAADYNRDVIPSSYSEDADLDKEAQNAKSDEEALAFADKLDQIAEDIGNHRGDAQQSFELRDYAQRIRDLVAKRKSQQPEQGLGQEAPDASAIYDRSRELAWNRAEPYSSDEDYTQESEAIRTQLEEIQEHIADKSLTDLRNMLNDPDYALVREDAQKAINKIDAELNSAVDEAIASGDINKLESLLRDPDFAEFDLVLKEKIDELKSADEGLGQESPKA